MPYNDPHHVVKTSAQWDERAIEFWVVPRGCLCVELTPEGKTKIKIGEGNKFYSQLPYVNDMSDLENYYTKEEVDNIVTNINLMAIRSTDEYDTKNDLPTGGNKLGDVCFVKSTSPSIKTDPDVYLWNGSRWIYVGYELQDIDLSQYLKKDEFHELFDPVREKVEEMYPKMHTHENKNILDRIEEPYSTAEKEKLAGLENYDDTEIRELIAETGHTHTNKSVLDTITDDSLWSKSDRTKFESLHNYDDTGVRNRLTDLESTAHTHSNKNILDQVTAAFTVEDKTKLDSLHNNEVFIGTDGMYGGREGLVPAPTIIDAGKFLCADGTWKVAGEIVYDFRGATASEDGTNGLVPAPLAGEQSYYLRGDGTWAKVKSGDKYRAGDGIYILAGDTSSTTLPVEIYAKANKLKQYVLYGGEDPVGDWDSTLSKYAVVIKVSAEGMSDISTSLFLDDPIGNGDYIDYENQRFVHTRTNMTFGVRSGEWNRWIHADGTTTGEYTYQDRMAPSDYIAVSPGYVYLYYPGNMHGCDQFNISCYAALYDENKVFTRSILLRSFTEVTIEPQPGEAYMRVSYGYYQGDTYRLTKIGEVITPIVLPPVIIYTNKVNTIDVMTTNKPTEVYFETAVVEDTSEDPMSEYTGIIYNEGVLDITQEDPNALNELTVHFRESDKVITIPASGGGDSYAEGQGIEFTHDPRSAELPNTYQQIEYLQGTGTQGIILNYTPMSTTPADIKYELTYSDLVSEPTGWHYLIGGWLESSHKMPPSIVYSNNNYQDKLVLSICEADIITNGDWPTGNTVHTSIVTIAGSTAKMQLDNGTESSGTWSGSIDHAPAIFASNRGSGTLGSFSAYKFRELKIYENGILIHHYYPCYRKSDNEPGIYDVITNTFSTNNGTGDFICGNDVNYDDTFINAKLGNGLSFDANGAIEAIPYTLPTASASTLGGVKVGDGLEIDEDGVLSAPGGTPYVAGDGIMISDGASSFELNENTVTNTEYFFDTRVTSNISGRIFTKYTTEPALGAVVYYGYTQPFFVGLTADSVKYGTNYDSHIWPNPNHPPFEYKGVTWYYSGNAYGMTGDGTDSSGHMQKLPGNYSVATEEDLQNIARAIIDAADIIMSPAKAISAKIGEGLEVDSNNDINVKIGDGLYFDANGAIAASGDNDYTAGEGIDIIGTTRPIDINYIRLDINNSRDNGSGGIIQFRNIRVLDNNGNSLQFSHASSIYGDGSAVEYGQNTRDESPQAMIEGRNKTCCTNFSLTKAPLKITFTLTSEISIANITSFSILTGADYTTRDPVSWDIYASNDGATWYKIQEAHSPDVTTARSTWITDIPFVIPPDAVEVLPGVKTITAKIGDGLSFDENDAITVDEMTGASASADGAPGTVPAPLIGDENKFLRGDGTWQTVSGGTEYQAGQGIEIETDTVATYEDLHFDYYAFKDKIQGVLNGSISFDIPNHALTISATNNYCYVFPYIESDGQLYKIPVEPNEDYLLTWEVNDTTIAGKVDVFENGNVTVGHYDPAGRESAASQQFLFTTSSTAETIHIRPYVYDAGTSLTFSNFQLYHVIYDTSGKIINAKLGTGLTFDANDAIELDNAIKITLNCNNEPD